MKLHFVEIENPETQSSFFIDLEGPYRPEDDRTGEHSYGITLFIDNVPYHFEKYIPTHEEIQALLKENKGEPQLSEGRFLYRLIPFTK